jgi:hypothetical protein
MPDEDEGAADHEERESGERGRLPANLSVVDHHGPTSRTAASLSESEEFGCAETNDIREVTGGRMPG